MPKYAAKSTATASSLTLHCVCCEQGKVRDTYELDDKIVIVTTDRCGSCAAGGARDRIGAGVLPQRMHIVCGGVGE